MSEYNNSLQKIKNIKSNFNMENLCNIFSDSTILVTGTVNNINKPATYANNIIKIQDFSTDNLRKSKEGSLFSELVCRNNSSTSQTFNVTILNVIDHSKIHVESRDVIPSKLYIVGQIVNDKRILSKEKIRNISIVAMQELDNKFQKLESEVKSIHSELKNIDSQLQTLINSFNNNLKDEKVHELQEKVNTNRSGLRKMII